MFTLNNFVLVDVSADKKERENTKPKEKLTDGGIILQEKGNPLVAHTHLYKGVVTGLPKDEINIKLGDIVYIDSGKIRGTIEDGVVVTTLDDIVMIG